MGCVLNTCKNNSERMIIESLKMGEKDFAIGVRDLMLDGKRKRNGKVLCIRIKLDLREMLTINHLMSFFRQQWRLYLEEEEHPKRKKWITLKDSSRIYEWTDGSGVARARPMT